MAAITASMVAELRAKTDAPMMECKKALTEAEGNMDKAEELLRVKLGSKAGKAASRVTADGLQDRPIRIVAIEVKDNPRYPYKSPIPLTVIAMLAVAAIVPSCPICSS